MNHCNAGHQKRLPAMNEVEAAAAGLRCRGNRPQDHLEMYNCGASPGTLSVALDVVSQDQRDLEKVRGRTPEMTENVQTLLSLSGEMKAERGQD